MCCNGGEWGLKAREITDMLNFVLECIRDEMVRERKGEFPLETVGFE